MVDANKKMEDAVRDAGEELQMDPPTVQRAVSAYTRRMTRQQLDAVEEERQLLIAQN